MSSKRVQRNLLIDMLGWKKIDTIKFLRSYDIMIGSFYLVSKPINFSLPGSSMMPHADITTGKPP